MTSTAATRRSLFLGRILRCKPCGVERCVACGLRSLVSVVLVGACVCVSCACQFRQTHFALCWPVCVCAFTASSHPFIFSPSSPPRIHQQASTSSSFVTSSRIIEGPACLFLRSTTPSPSGYQFRLSQACHLEDRLNPVLLLCDRIRLLVLLASKAFSTWLQVIIAFSRRIASSLERLSASLSAGTLTDSAGTRILSLWPFSSCKSLTRPLTISCT